MPVDPLQALHSALRRTAPPAAPHGTLLIAGATGALGSELVRRFAGHRRFAHTRVLTKVPMRDGLRGVETVQVPMSVGPAATPIADWPRVAADTAIVSFDPPRLYNDRERALWLPEPDQLPELARWLHGCGVRSLAVVQPHAQGRLPEALKRGLASLDEHAVATTGFDRVLLVRSAQKPGAARVANPAEWLAAWMLSALRFMVPDSERPVRPAKVAELVDVALQLAPPGVHVAAPEVVWRAAQGTALRAVAQDWLRPSDAPLGQP